MELGPEHVGRRVVVRRVLPGERGPSGGPALTDVLGVLEALTDETLLVRRDDGDVVTVDRVRVVAAKPVPARTSARPRITPEALQIVCEAGWRAPVRERLGDWLLRAADGFTGRANSVLPVGDPGLPLDAALQQVQDFYARVQLRVQAQVIIGSGIADDLQARGWVAARPGQADTLVQVAALAATGPGPYRGSGAADVRLSERLDDDWLLRYGRSAGNDPGVVRSVLESGERVTFAQVAEPAIAVGRAVVTRGWLGLSAVEVEVGQRRHGLGSAVVDALLAWGSARGARSAYVQVLADNDAALALYARRGFRTHHGYRYLRPPST
jgi:ribosomal protein S18 acetylase RimI-like enzyme